MNDEYLNVSKASYGRNRGWSADYIAYWIDHIFCEACGQPNELPPHHILSRGAYGVIDDAWNLLSLCFECHVGIYHGMGPSEFIIKYGFLGDKVRKALDHTYYKKKHGKRR